MMIKGSCHCGNIRFALDWTPEPTEIPARACGCSFCVKRGGVWTSNPDGRLEVTTRDRAAATEYRFGTQSAVFHLCTRCGGVPVVSSTIDGVTYAVVSVTAFDNVDPALLKRSAADFEGEDLAARLARRQRGWIRDVRFKEAEGHRGGAYGA